MVNNLNNLSYALERELNHPIFILKDTMRQNNTNSNGKAERMNYKISKVSICTGFWDCSHMN